MSQAFELYAQAFKLQTSGNRRGAWELYQRIIEDFPDSRESDYAQVQVDQMAPARADHRAAMVLSTAALGLSLLIAAVVGAMWHGVREAQDTSAYYGHIAMAVAADQAGDEAVFNLHLARAREIHGRLADAYLLRAERHIRMKNFKAALDELKKCPSATPEVRFYYEKIQKLTRGKTGGKP